MVANHTPGPWEFDVDADEITTPDRIEQGRVCIAAVETGWSEPFESEQQANARLIAAAPTMHEYIAKRADAGDNEAKQILESINAGR